MTLMVTVIAGVPVLLQSTSGYGRFLEDLKVRNWLRNDCFPVHVREIRKKREMFSSIMTRAGRLRLEEGVVWCTILKGLRLAK